MHPVRDRQGKSEKNFTKGSRAQACMNILCVCVWVRERVVSVKSQVVNTSQQGLSAVINIWQLSGTCFMSTEARTFPFPNILLALMWRLNWSWRRTKLDGDWPSGMLIIFLTRSCISYKICCYYSSAVVIIGRFSIFLATFFFFGFDIWRISLFSFTPLMLFLRVSSEK